MTVRVYILTSGEESDYCIDGVFSSPELAEAYRKAWPSDEVEEWELDPCNEQISAGLLFFEIRMKADTGDVDKCWQQPPAEKSVSDIVTVSGSVKENIFVPGAYRQFRWWGWAKDEKHAVEIANEQRIIALAALPPQKG